MSMTETVLGVVIKDLSELDATLSGDDSPLSSVWEEIKDQVQNEESNYWDAYVATMRALIQSYIYEMSTDDLAVLCDELFADEDDDLCSVLCQELLDRARAEEVVYKPYDFEFFYYFLAGVTTYGQILKRTGRWTAQVRVWSQVLPENGEFGEMSTSSLDCVISQEIFEFAKMASWPEISVN